MAGNNVAEHNARVLAAAKWYINKGWAVFPVHSVDDEGQCTCGIRDCSNAGKHPINQNGFKGASKDIAKIEEWFEPTDVYLNIGLATGNVSGTTLLDIDIGDGKKGAETWAELVSEHGEPNTLRAVTGSGGAHVYFQYNSALKSSGNTLGPGVDCRNDGGFAVLPPSRHYKGGAYKWEDARAQLAPLPAHLTKKIAERRGRPRKDDPTRKKYSIEEVVRMLEFIPSDDRDLWRNVGIILGREFNCAEEAWEAYVAWSDKTGGAKGRNHDEIMREAFYDLSQQTGPGNERTIGTIVKFALDNGWAPVRGSVDKERFVYVGDGNCYMYRTNNSRWQAIAVDAAVSPINDGTGKLVKASDWLKEHRFATTMTVAPAYSDGLVRDHEVNSAGQVEEAPGTGFYNMYRPPKIYEDGEARYAEPFIRHVRKVFPRPAPAGSTVSDADQFLDYMAHRAQKPGERTRFALLIAGEMGTGKDTAIEMCIPAIGHWNVSNISPDALESGFNEFAAYVLVRINEAANAHDMSKWAFNEASKVLIGGDPDNISINPKYGTKFNVNTFNGTIVTTNHLATGIYIPEGDRRYDVIESATVAEMGVGSEDEKRAYFLPLWKWFKEGGYKHIQAFLLERDISNFSPDVGQRKTEAHKTTVMFGKSSDEWLADALDALKDPKALRVDQLLAAAEAAGQDRNSIRPKISAALTRAGYQMARNPEVKDGRWRINGKLVSVWALKDCHPISEELWATLRVEAF